MKITLHVITTVCIRRGKMYNIGDLRHEVHQPTEFRPIPPALYTERADSMMGKFKEVLRTVLEIDAPELDSKELTKLRLKELKAQRKDAEATFYATTKRIDDEIASLLAIESK